ncbi:YgaP family membrane protein [Methylovorus mays]|uniref:YgaP family membrane protein n=1 Tax=Methylovorus mays TaxID=184077 RepID=UPI001E53FECD|nr:DUF2892 domain-containing protein [Methylovorus mays]MCB5207761.1 DUF2892 domain-containing protein [Methylovorus mays]
MRKNVGSNDSVMRIVSGVALLGAMFWIQSPWRWLGLLGIVYLMTGILRWCPAYALFGVSTCTPPVDD